MPSISDLLGSGSVAEQLLVWGLLQELLGDFLGPMLELIRQDVNAGHPINVLTPADLASAVVRNFMDRAAAEGEAAKNGIDPARLQTLIDLAGDAPGPSELATALRRGIIPETGAGADSVSFTQGIAEGRLADKWAPIIKALAVYWPTPTDALDALLEGQVDEATGKALYQRFGGDPDYFTLLFNTRGTAPTPMEAIEMANRGLMPWDGEGPGVTSFHQAFLEGPWRNKWESIFRGFAVYIPPPRTVTTLLSHGVISDAQAQEWFQKTGMTPETAKAYVASAVAAKTTTHRQLTESNVQALYLEQLLTRTQAEGMLEDLGYDPDTANYVLEAWDFARARSAYQSAVTRVGSFYTGRKIDRPSAIKALQSLDVPDAAVTHLMAGWDAERAMTVKELTAAEVVDAVYYEVKDQAWALEQLEKLGYTAHDAWVKLSVRMHGAVPGEPGEGPNPGEATPVV